MRSTTLIALAASLSTSAAVFQGFNYGSTKSDGSSFNFQADFQAQFQTAKNLVGTSGFTSARLYTMIQGGSSTNEPTQAIPAAIAEDVSLLLTVWASGGDGPFQAELTALKSAITQYKEAFTNLVVGIAVGSEDLYRISPTGIAALSGAGADPDTLVSYINQVRTALQGTSLSGALIGHVDTWTAWVNGSNSAVSAACDFIGMDAYPYFQNTEANGIDDGADLFNSALAATQAAVGGKPVWITETGWPVSGKTENLAIPSTANAKTYWDQVGCPNFGKVNTWWYTLQDTAPTTPNPSFGIVSGNPLSTTPLFDLSCSDVSSSSATSQSSTAAPSSSSSVAVSGSTGSSAQASATSSIQASATSSKASAASSVSSAATSDIVSSGGQLSPSQGAGNGISVSSAAGTTTAATSSPSGVTGFNGSSSSSVGASSNPKTSSTGSASGTSSAPLSLSTNAANVLSGSLVGAMGALFVAAAAL